MRSVFLRLQCFWLERRDGLIGAALCVVLAAALFGTIDYISGARLQNISGSKPLSIQTDGRIIGFVGGDSKFSSGMQAYVLTHEKSYALVGLPYSSGCRNGDRISLDEWQLNGRNVYRFRQRGCARGAN
jgi:hypothetical protein